LVNFEAPVPIESLPFVPVKFFYNFLRLYKMYTCVCTYILFICSGDTKFGKPRHKQLIISENLPLLLNYNFANNSVGFPTKHKKSLQFNSLKAKRISFM
jgi:hypothetical protein